MAGLGDFANRMRRIAVQVEGNVDRAVKDCAGAAAKSVIQGTPVDTGAARSNWLAALDAPAAGTVPAHAPGTAGSTGDANAAVAIEQVGEVIEKFDLAKNKSIHITNNLPYIGALNDGHSRQAPADFVRLAVLDGLAKVRGAKLLEE
jgi:hypothetical protein